MICDSPTVRLVNHCFTTRTSRTSRTERKMPLFGSYQFVYIGQPSWVREFSDSSQLEVMIHQIELFFDQERENWARSKRRYRRIERQFARTLLVAIRTIRKNLFWSLLVKPPVDRITFLRLMVCYGFRPFHTHWTTKQRRSMKRKMNVIRYYYEHFNQLSQEDMRSLIDRNDKLLV